MTGSSQIPTLKDSKDAPDPVAAPVQVRRPTKSQTLNTLYALPAPIRTFPLPTFIPHNPLSVFHILYVWLSQTIQQPKSHFDIPYQGWYSLETRSIHVTDTRSINGLWQQGFYGKGNLSRSELNWLDREKARRGISAKLTSEEVTAQRRAERQQTKWERARKEREAIDQKLLEEAEAALEDGVMLNGELSRPGEIQKDAGGNSVVSVKVARKFFSPVGPLELLSLPNSALELNSYQNEDCLASISSAKTSLVAPVGPLEILAPPKSHVDWAKLGTDIPGVDALAMDPITHKEPSESDSSSNSAPDDHQLGLPNRHANSEILEDVTMNGVLNGSAFPTPPIGLPNSSALTTASTPKIKCQKSVRFSPTVEKTTFIPSSPPSPSYPTAPQIEEAPLSIPDKEHYQLTFEEAFFLSYALGSLTVLDPSTHNPFSNRQLFTLFQQFSHFPPILNPLPSPDSPFLLSYVVYHHFRSLGWVVRGGIKFSVDYLLYNRGPPFSHAEFAILILPAYTAPYWSSNPFLENYAKEKEKRSWAWLHCVNRVITQVKKTLVLVYVDIPAPWDGGHKEGEMPIDEILGRYKVREVVMQRWAANRSRD